jgi:putative endonuclease
MHRVYHVYIVASLSRVLYVGVTNNLFRRVLEHRCGRSTFSARYRASRLVHYEATTDARTAITREKQIKGWTRARKLALVEGENPRWLDLARHWYSSELLREYGG